jgi:hypothetical protein
MHGYALSKLRYSAHPHDISAQIDLIGMPLLMIREIPSDAPIGGYLLAPMILLVTQGDGTGSHRQPLSTRRLLRRRRSNDAVGSPGSQSPTSATPAVRRPGPGANSEHPAGYPCARARSCYLVA